MKFKLTYFKKENAGDPDTPVFNTKKGLIRYLDDELTNDFRTVFLCANDCNSDFFISTSPLAVQEFIKKMTSWGVTNCLIHIHEYPSYEDAQKVAASMTEGHPLEYSIQPY